jgi:hypothetical protein
MFSDDKSPPAISLISASTIRSIPRTLAVPLVHSAVCGRVQGSGKQPAIQWHSSSANSCRCPSTLPTHPFASPMVAKGCWVLEREGHRTDQFAAQPKQLPFAFQRFDMVYDGNDKSSGLPRGIPLATRMVTSSEHAWDLMAPSSAKLCLKTCTVHRGSSLVY